MRSTPVAAALAVAALGCGGADAGATADAFTVRDSAGIRIVENRDSAWTETTRWRLADEPDLVIGSIDGTVPGTDFSRIDDVFAVGDRIVVEESAVRELRVFSAEGVFERAFGGSGEGPLEFSSVRTTAALEADSIAAYDLSYGKVVAFPVGGGEGISVATPPRTWEGGRAWMVGALRPSDGGYVMWDPPLPAAEALPAGLHLLTSPIHLFSRAGEPIRRLGEVPVVLWQVFGDGTFQPVSFSPNVTFRVAGRTLYQAFPVHASEIRTFDLEDGTEGRIRIPLPRHPAPDDLRETLIEWQLESARSQGVSAARIAEVRPSIERETVVDTLPPFFEHLVSPDGHQWLHLHPDLREIGPDGYLDGWSRAGGAWAIVDPEGRWLGTIRPPETLEIRSVGADYLLGVRRDELGIPWVERWPILMPGS